MFTKWFKSNDQPASTACSENAAFALNAVEMVLAMDILQTAQTLSPLSYKEALLVTQHLQARRYIFDEVLMRAGDRENSGFMLWILEGQALIEAVSSNPQNPVTMTVLEAGNTIGEIGLMDGQARSATCTACSHMRCAMLTRESLLSLTATHPDVATKLMFIISVSMATRLRGVTEKFRRYVLMANAIRDELMASNGPRPLTFSDQRSAAQSASAAMAANAARGATPIKIPAPNSSAGDSSDPPDSANLLDSAAPSQTTAAYKGE